MSNTEQILVTAVCQFERGELTLDEIQTLHERYKIEFVVHGDKL